MLLALLPHSTMVFLPLYLKLNREVRDESGVSGCDRQQAWCKGLPATEAGALTGSEMPDSARSATNEIPRGKYTGRWQQRGTVLLSIIAVFFGMDDVLAILFL